MCLDTPLLSENSNTDMTLKPNICYHTHYKLYEPSKKAIKYSKKNFKVLLDTALLFEETNTDMTPIKKNLLNSKQTQT